MDVFFLVLLIVLGLIFINSFKKRLSPANLLTLKKLYFFHLIFGSYYCFFVIGDSIGYWQQAKVMTYQNFIYSIFEQQGTYFIYAFNYFPANVLNLSYFTGTIIYSLIGFVGLTYFYLIAVELVPENSKFKGFYLFPLLFFLPNLHFWSCAVGKDTLLFFCIALFVYGLLSPYKRIGFLVISLLLSYLIRPHITLFMLLSFGMAFISGKNLSLFRRTLFLSVIASICVIIFPLVLKFSKIEEATIESFDKFSTLKAIKLSSANTTTAIDISSYPFPLKVFSFLFRPFFFDISSIPSLLASFENLLLITLTVFILKNQPIKSFKKSPFVIQGMIYFLIIGTLAFSQSLGNIGIMIRMRNMFLPGLIIFILWHFYYVNKQNEEEEEEEEEEIKKN